jgi:septum formation protein
METSLDKAQLILASASPRRRELLDQIGVSYHVVISDADESVHDGESPRDYVYRVAREKALEVKQRAGAGKPVLAADTAVILDGRIFGKPHNRVQAIEMLQQLSGRTHEVWSAVALIAAGGRIVERLNVTQVTFSALEPGWIEAYCDSGDPMDKAGAYGVQGMAAQKIFRLEGSYSGVMGLPLHETSEILEEAGLLNVLIQSEP